MVIAKDLMRTDLITVSKEATVSEVIDILAEKGITGLPVVEDDMTIIGLISEKDVLQVAYRIIAHSYDPASSKATVEKLMAKELVTFSPDDNLADICQCFLDRSIRRVPVVDDGKLVGIISRKDIITLAFKTESGS